MPIELPVAAEQRRCRARARLLVALYALFLMLMGVHLMVHDHGTLLAAGDGPPVLAATCGDHCGDPAHHHRDHTDKAICPICQVVNSIGTTPLVSTYTIASLAIGRLTCTQLAPLPPPGHLAAHPARAPPFVRSPITTA